MLIAGLCVFSGVASARAADWLRVQPQGARHDLWVDLDHGRLQLDGDCAESWRPERFDRRGGRIEIEWVDTLEGDLPGAVIQSEQRWFLDLTTTSGTLRIDGATAAGSLVLPVTVEHRSDGPRCH